MIKTAEKYIDDALTGKIAVSKITRLTFERHRRDLLVAPENGWFFDKKAVQRVFDFFRFNNHCPDKRTWVPFHPEPWQAAIIYIVFGWKKIRSFDGEPPRPAGGPPRGGQIAGRNEIDPPARDIQRRFNYVYIEVPKKNGKTTFAAALANYLLFFDGEQDGEVYCAASVEKQAKICFTAARKMIEHSPDLKRRAKLLTKNVNIPSTSSKLEMLGRDSDTMEGINPSAGIIDELHVWKNLQVLENMESASVARSQPLFFIITTSGRDKSLPCFEKRNLYIEILKGIKTQDNTFALIYTPDEEDDWKDETTWKKVNPNWGVSVRPDRFRDAFTAALNDRSEEVNFKTKNLDIWVDAPEIWIPDEKWQACSHGTRTEDLRGKSCYWGLDLAAHVDINALALFFPDVNGHPVVKMFFWIPEAKIAEMKDRVDYALWAKQGRINVTKGDVIEIDDMVEDVVQIMKEYKCEGFGYDPAKAYHGVIQGLIKQGFPQEKMDAFSQGIVNMSAPTRELEKMVVGGTLDHLNDPVLRWMMGNVVIKRDSNDNIKPDKLKSRNKIDGITALVVAIGEYMTVMYGKDKKEIYTDHSLRFL